MARDGTDRAYREAMVAAEHDRQALQHELGRDRLHHRAIPCDDFREVPVAVVRREPRIEGARDVAAIHDIEAAFAQRLGDARDAQCFGAHRGAAVAGANVGRRADQRDRWKLLHCIFFHKDAAGSRGTWAAALRDDRERNLNRSPRHMAHSRRVVFWASANASCPRSRTNARSPDGEPP